ncbi:P-loop NTPase [Pseudoalteromonas sp. S4741]|uniref:P-loop NTPase n=1 Tax=Pseudoalteromonas sp. S4741 TaxID=579563 RepID=UPI00110C039B|nr:P-loop NTPase [Pseudoalteromonas sp. S4741]TMO28186.1 chromosome partitioning protein ParA [Pseudoalteromonas sp. S4741]
MSVNQFPNTETIAVVPADCSKGHACQFCPEEPNCTLDKSHHEKRLLESRLGQIGQIIMVMANKGGVGKSTVSANVAAGLAGKGFRVGVADADVHGPNQSRFFGFVGERVKLSASGLPTHNFTHSAIAHPVKVGTLAFMMDRDDTPIVWRDSYKHDFMHHLLGSFDWGHLDYLIIDMPPGTGNELITLADMLEGQDVAALLVTTAQEVALMDSLKAVRFCQERQLPIIGAVENMAGVTCPHCSNDFHIFPRDHLAAALASANIGSLAQIPLSPALASGSDTGVPAILGAPHSPEAQAFNHAVEACQAHAQAIFAEAAKASLAQFASENATSEDLQSALDSVPADQKADIEQQLSSLLGNHFSSH